MRAVSFPAPPPAACVTRRRPDVSVVVITRDRPTSLRRCLESLSRQTAPPLEVIVVDSSEAEHSEAVARAFPGVRHLRFPAGRRGMPAARNAGTLAARGDVVAFLDDDCEASAGWLEGLIAAYGDPEVAGAGGKVTDPVVTLGGVRRFLVSGEPWAEPDDDDARRVDVDFLQGGNMSFRREVLLAAGGFDPAYSGSNYREETDLCFRLRRAGRRLRYVPEASVAHRRAPRVNGVARSSDDALRELYHARNQTYFVLKNYGLAARPLAFYLGLQTWQRIVAAARRPSPPRLAWLAAHLGGKALGIAAAARYRLARTHGDAR